MNAKKILKTIRKLSSNKEDIEKLLVKAFIMQHPILHMWESNILNFWESEIAINSVNNSAIELLSTLPDMSIENLIECFELLVSTDEKKEKGITYTPCEIKNQIINSLLSENDIPKVIDPACGCGAFLISAVEIMNDKYGISYKEAIENYIFGIDIDNVAIRRAKVLLSLLTYLNGEGEICTFHLYVANSLDSGFVNKLKSTTGGFECVIGNPPYVRYRNLSDEQKDNYIYWETSKGGNVDLYMPFFEVGLLLLKEKGALGFISPNGYLQGVNGRNLRNYLIEKGYPVQIIDFRDAQIFKSVTSYTCITFISTEFINPVIKYVRANEINSLSNYHFTTYKMDNFSHNEPWRMRRDDIDTVIGKLESSGTPLGSWKIRNGLATLKNDLFFFIPAYSDAMYYYRNYNGKQYKIEKSICISVVKPNIIKNEKDLDEKCEVAIFPYFRGDKGFVVVEEDELRDNYPSAYSFLSEYKTELANRDKGKGKYAAWYAYGRTQGMNNFGKKLLIPYIADKPIAVLSLDPDLLFYCGYAIMSDNEEELRILKCFLESEAFWYYIFHTSKPYAKGYMAFAKNYITKFTIPVLCDDEKKMLLSFKTNSDRDRWIWSKYQVDVE